MKKVIIAGSRNFKNYNLLKSTLDNLFIEPFIVVSGCANGADSLGEKYALEKGYAIEKHPAKWSDLNETPCVIKYNNFGAYNSMAGHNRNKRMLNSVLINEDKGCVVVFWDGLSKGTQNMIKIAKEAGLDVKVVIY